MTSAVPGRFVVTANVPCPAVQASRIAVVYAEMSLSIASTVVRVGQTAPMVKSVVTGVARFHVAVD